MKAPIKSRKYKKLTRIMTTSFDHPALNGVINFRSTLVSHPFPDYLTKVTPRLEQEPERPLFVSYSVAENGSVQAVWTPLPCSIRRVRPTLRVSLSLRVTRLRKPPNILLIQISWLPPLSYAPPPPPRHTPSTKTLRWLLSRVLFWTALRLWFPPRRLPPRTLMKWPSRSSALSSPEEINLFNYVFFYI